MVRGRCLGIRQLSSSFATLFFPNAMVKAHRHICRNIFEISIINLQTYANMISCYLLFSFCFSLSLYLYMQFSMLQIWIEKVLCCYVSSTVFLRLWMSPWVQQLSFPNHLRCIVGSTAKGLTANPCESLRCSSCSVPLWGLGFSLPRGL
jgi:hypothetical protein